MESQSNIRFDKIIHFYFSLGWKYVFVMLCFVGMALNAFLINYAFEKVLESRENTDLTSSSSTESLVVEFGPPVEHPIQRRRN